MLPCVCLSHLLVPDGCISLSLRVPARPGACTFPVLCVHAAVCNKAAVVRLLWEGSSEFEQGSVAAVQKAAWALLGLRPENRMGAVRAQRCTPHLRFPRLTSALPLVSFSSLLQKLHP